MAHNDGWGLMWIQNRRVQSTTSISKNFAVFLTTLKSVEKYGEIGFHLRTRTYGDLGKENCSPHQVFSLDNGDNHDLMLMHNGEIETGHPANDAKSDTRHFITEKLRPALKANPNLLEESKFRAAFGGIMGKSKFLFLDDKGLFTLINQNLGVIHGNCWFSNPTNL